jgi:multiphosphoryl transfer protein
MIGIVIVSHSQKLAEGVKELAEQMVQVAVPIAIAAGVDDPQNPLGTDVMRVYEAIRSVYREEGTLVLMDLGSAVMSAEMALEFLTDTERQNVRLCEAALVEGTIIAVVQSAAGSDLETILTETRGAIAAKARLLESPASPPRLPQPGRRGERQIRVSVINPLGIHARPAAQWVQMANRFQSQITVQNLTKNSPWVNGKSINEIITLGVRCRDELALEAVGIDAPAALTALQNLVTSGFGEINPTLQTSNPPLVNPMVQGEIRGVPASPGIAVAPAILYHLEMPEIPRKRADNPDWEWQELQMALETARQELQILSDRLTTEESGIFQAHQLYLWDPALIDIAYHYIFEHRLHRGSAWKAAIDEIADKYKTIEEIELQSRADDVRDVGVRVLRLLMPEIRLGRSLHLTQPGILVAPELQPSEVAQLDPKTVLGLCTARGGVNTHSAIIARSLGIPAVMGMGRRIANLTSGTELAIDGTTGQVWVQPDPALVRELQNQPTPPPTTDLVPKSTDPEEDWTIPLLANIVGISGAEVAREVGAEGIGLFRTEFLYLDRGVPPTEAEQVSIYREIASIFESHPTIIRTFDIGGDKPLTALNAVSEPNPFLGWRGIRLALEQADWLKTQLRAILRVSADAAIQVMFPTIASLWEIRAARKLLLQAQEELRQERIPFNPAIIVGMMIEVPAAVLIADQLAAEVDFFSIGTNDLSQYLLAADRSNPKVSAQADALEPAVLRAIQHIVTVAHNVGISVSVCGELASDPEATPILVGLGVDKLSMNPRAIPAIKATLSLLNRNQAHEIATSVLQLDSARAVRNYLTDNIRY